MSATPNINPLKITGNNLAATQEPTVSNDSSEGYSIGSKWIDTTNDKIYFCLDATVNAAEWSESGFTSPLTAKGDVYTNNGTTDVALPVGTDGQALVANSSTTTGLEWQTFSSIYGVELEVPTEPEWQNEISSWSAASAEGAFASSLKLTNAGSRIYNTGVLYNVNTYGMYVTSSVNTVNINLPINTESRNMFFKSSSNGGSPYVSFNDDDRANARSVRLIVGGKFTQAEYTSSYSTKTIEYLGLTYGFVYNTTTHRIWLDRNLGATQVATSLTDNAAYGHLYQWGRPADGHEVRTSAVYDGALGKPSLAYETGDWDGKFIKTIVSPNDWLSVQDSSLWQNKGSLLSKSFTLQEPVNADNITIFRTDSRITVAEVIAVLYGSATAVTYQLKFGTSRVTGTPLTTLTSPSGTVTSLTVGNIAELGDATIPADSWVWAEFTAPSSATAGQYITIDIRYTED